MKRQRSGFTLIELLVVIAIIGIIAAIMVPVINSKREDGRRGFPLGKQTGRPVEGVIYEVTAVDSNASTVIAIRHDENYVSNTLGRVMIRVSDKVCQVGTYFVRRGDDRDHIVTMEMITVTNQVQKLVEQ